MLQGLGEAHNADVLLEPPVQTPFLNKIRLLVEYKDYKRKVGLDVVQDALGLREDVNHFELVDANELLSSKTQRRIVCVAYAKPVWSFVRLSIE